MNRFKWHELVRRQLPFLVIAGIAAVPLRAGQIDDRWWPVQAFPKAVLRTSNQQEFPQPRLALQMMVQSVAGLAAKAVNQGRGTEMVWVDNGDGDLERWYSRLLAYHPALEARGTFGPWELADHFAKQGVIRGYILYRSDKADGNAPGAERNFSVNVATSMAGLLDAIIVDEDLEPTAKAHGLKLLFDVRDKTQAWCFRYYHELFSRKMLCIQNPLIPHSRDLAIAQKAFTVYGQEEPAKSAIARLEPLSPILGENEGDEFANTDLSTGYGDIQTATDWCLNLPVLMAGTEQFDVPRTRRLDPRTIDWTDVRSAVSFVSSDGDNTQWMEGNFFSNESYWGNLQRGRMPFGWSCCFSELAQLCPEALYFAQATESTNDCFVEWGGGYYYPDRFARLRKDRWELLARQARRTWELMKKTGTCIVGFNFSQTDSSDARHAYEVIASQTDGLLAIFAYQYSAYEGGAGKTFWVKDAKGIDVPVITARYAIWEHLNGRDRAGTPAKVAHEIWLSAESASPHARYDWVVDHFWSYFQRVPGNDENAENMPQENAAPAGVRGYSPALWCAERLPSNIRVVSPEELAWRIRMEHDRTQTRKLIAHFQ